MRKIDWTAENKEKLINVNMRKVIRKYNFVNSEFFSTKTNL